MPSDDEMHMGKLSTSISTFRAVVVAVDQLRVAITKDGGAECMVLHTSDVTASMAKDMLNTPVTVTARLGRKTAPPYTTLDGWIESITPLSTDDPVESFDRWVRNHRSRHGGYYSIIQYFPEPDMLEGVNVGVYVASKDLDAGEVLMSGSNDRVMAMFGPNSYDEHELSSDKGALADRLRAARPLTHAEIAAFASREAGNLMLTPPQPIAVTEPKTTALGLLADLCGPTPLTKGQRWT